MTAGYLFYIALPHLKKIVRNEYKKEDEVIPYKVAFWGLIASLLFICIWSNKAGLGLAIALFEFGIYIFVEALVMARATSEGGMIMI